MTKWQQIVLERFDASDATMVCFKGNWVSRKDVRDNIKLAEQMGKYILAGKSFIVRTRD